MSDELTLEEFAHELTTLLGLPMAVEFSCGDGPTEDDVRTRYDLILSQHAAMMELKELQIQRNAELSEQVSEMHRQLSAMKQERDEAERRGMERAAEAVLQTVIKFDVDWLRTATKAEAIAETLRQASAALRGT